MTSTPRVDAAPARRRPGPAAAALLAAGLTLGLTLGLLPAVVQGQAVDLAGVRFEPQVPLGGQTLVLNGAGIRCKAVFKGYAAGLYLGAKAGTPEAVLAAPGAKRIHVAHRELTRAQQRGQIATTTVARQRHWSRLSITASGAAWDTG